MSLENERFTGNKATEFEPLLDVIGNVYNPKLIGKKGKELWYPTYAPHIILGTNKSILNEIYIKYPDLRYYL